MASPRNSKWNKKRHNRRQMVPTPAGSAPRPILAPTAGSILQGGMANGGLTDLSQGSQFPPGEPLRPMPGVVPPDGGPRQWSYPVGYNIAQRPRSTEMTSFEALRNLSALFDGIQICERVYFDIMGRLELRVRPRDELLAEGEDERSPRWREPAARIEDFLSYPDRSQDLRSWLVALVRDLLEIDAVGVYRRRTRGGGLYALELVAGESLKPLIDVWGRTPEPPEPAYQQFLYGVPGGWYTRDELDYLKESSRTESVYGLSRVERIILRVNQALRKQDFDLARFTDGTTPLSVISPSETLSWTPEDVRLFEQTFNGLLAGNDQQRVRARVLPPGSKFEQLVGDDPLVAFDRFLLNCTVAAFGLTMDELGFTDTSNRSVGESQEAIVYRRAVSPVTNLVAGYLTRVVRSELDPRFTVSFGGIEEPSGFSARAEALAKLIPTGTISPSDAARLLKLPVKREVPAYIVVGQSVVSVDDFVAGKVPMPISAAVTASSHE